MSPSPVSTCLFLLLYPLRVSFYHQSRVRVLILYSGVLCCLCVCVPWLLGRERTTGHTSYAREKMLFLRMQTQLYATV